MPDTEFDLVVVGGGIVGLSLATHAARVGLSTLLLERGALGASSTRASGALVRTHYRDTASAALALRGLEDFENFEQRYGGSAGFRRTGFAYIPEASEVDDLPDRVERLTGLGIDTRIVDAGELTAIDPALNVDDVGIAVYEPRSGYANPEITCATLAAAASQAGAQLRPGTAIDTLVTEGEIVTGVRLATGETISAGDVALCAGAHSAALASTAGLNPIIRPTAVKLVLVERRVDTHLTVIDAPNGTYVRPDGDNATLVGRRTWVDEPLETPDTELPVVDEEFVEDAIERLARRIPSAGGAGPTSTRAGMLDMTPDGLPLLGPSGVDGLWLSCGWSGTGFKTAPAQGELLARWIAEGEMPDPLLAEFAPERELADASGGAVRSPH